jgi:hypothetical protein
MIIPTPKNIEAFTERVDNFIETITEGFPSIDAINTLAQEVNTLLANRQNGMNILALSVVLANVLRDMDHEHRSLALAGIVKMVLTMNEEEEEEEP